MAFNLTPRTNNADATITVHTDALLKYLDAVNVVVSKKSTFSILKTIRILIEEGKVLFRATDTDCFVEMTLPIGSCKGSVDVTVDYESLLAIVTKAPKGLMVIERNGNNLTYKVGVSACGQTECSPGNVFPNFGISMETSPYEYDMEPFDVSYVYNYVSSMCIEDKDYACISGVLVETDGTAFRFTATDRKMLVSTGMDLQPVQQHAIPRKAFKIADTLRTPFKLSLSSNYYMFSGNGIRIYGSYLKGLFPDVHKVVPTKFDHVHRVQVDVLRNELRSLMGSVKPTKDGIYPIMLSYANAIIHAVEVPSNYVLDKGGIKMDAARIIKLLDRFNNNSDVTFKSTCILERPTIWEDSKGITLLCCLR